MAGVYLTRTAAAKHVGVTYQEIKRALDRGELKMFRGKLELESVERLFAVKKLARKPRSPNKPKPEKSLEEDNPKTKALSKSPPKEKPVPIDSDRFKDSAEALFRKLKAEARLKELELQEKKGNLFSVDAYKKMSFEWARNIRDRIEAIPHRMQGVLDKEQTAILKNELRNTLTEIST